VIKLLGSRGASAVMGISMLAVGSSAGAQNLSLNVPAAVKALDVDLDVDVAAKPLDTVAQTVASTIARPAIAATTAVATAAGSILQTQPAQAVTVKLAPTWANEAAWLYKSGWPLYALVDKYSTGDALDEQGNCLATAVYFEARGESLEGQLAVAHVVMNRAASGRYPPDFCSVVKQPAQFSFVRHGEFPLIDTNSTAWARAQGIARLAMANIVPSVQNDVLWYHANYVAPSWGRRLNVVEKIGAHIFYRA
jgi:spore germination cell wall hydrolase CwlJ-like protein